MQKYRLIIKSNMTLEISIGTLTAADLRELSKIEDELDLFYYIQDLDADIFTGMGVDDSYIIDVYKISNFNQDDIVGSPILTINSTIDKLPVVCKKINNTPGDIFFSQVINSSGTIGHVDLELPELEKFDISKLSLTQYCLDNFDVESLCSKISVGETEFRIEHSLFTNLVPKVEMSHVSYIDHNGAIQTLYDEYGNDEGWDQNELKKVLAEEVL
jgi:hypothetical protein